ncbi:MAG: glycosyltransferase [Anaerolineales bacterium]
MRVAVFTNAYKPAVSGVVTSIDLFRQGLWAAGHEAHIFAPEYEAYDDEEAYVFRLPALDLTEQLNVSIVLPFKNLIDLTMHGIRPDVIHSQHPVWMGDLAASFARDLERPLVFTFHTQYEQYAQFYSPVAAKLAERLTEDRLRRYLEQCAHIIAPTESVRRMLESRFDLHDMVTVIPTPVDLKHFQSAPAGEIRQKYGLHGKELLLFVGRIAKEKNLGLLFKAFARVRAQRPAAHLMLVGKGPFEAQAQELVRKLGVEDAVTFAGGVPHAQIPAYYRDADLFVFSSTSETQGLVLVESMAAGTPVVAVEAPGSSDILSGGGRLTAPDSAGLAEGMLAVLSAAGEMERLAREAIGIAERYSIAGATERMLAVYDRVLTSAGFA